MTRICRKCETTLPLESYQRDKSKKDGRATACPPCRKAEKAAYYIRNRERILAQAAEYRAAHSDAIREQQAGWRLENRDSLREKNFEKQYGISWDARMKMLGEQGGRCAICRTDEHRGREWHMDHDHACCPEKARSCGKCVRGLLCSRCNIAIGLLDDNPVVMQSAIEYVSRMRPAAG